MTRRKHHQSRRAAGTRPDRPRPDDSRKIRPPAKGGPAQLWIYGRHAAGAALANPAQTVLALVATRDSAPVLAKLGENAARPLPDMEIVDRAELETRLPAGALHQGLAVRCEPLPDRALADLLAELDPAAPALLVGLDQVTDPQNVGAILRSAAAFGATGLFLTERNAAPETGALARAASGALDVTPLVRVGNLAKALDELKSAGFWIFGLAGDGDIRLDEAELPDRTALLFGAEGSGLRRLTRERCDRLVRLPTTGPIDQLNVSNAAAVALYEATRRRL